MSTHPPEQIYSEEAANVGFVMALGIMSAVAIVLICGYYSCGFLH